MDTTSRWKRARILTGLAGLLVLAPQAAEGSGIKRVHRLGRAESGIATVSPGESLRFGAADFASGARTLGSGLEVFVTYPAAPGQTEYTGALNFALGGSTVIDGEASTVFQYHQFTVAADADTMGTPVRALVSGRLEMQGLLALLNLGSVNLLFAVDVLDVTNDPSNRDPISGEMITSQTLFTESMTGATDLDLSIGVSVDAGSATAAQVGLEPAVGIEFPIQAVRINKSTGFGLDAVLKRGHTYRVVTYATATMTSGPGGGAGLAVFVDPESFPAFDKSTLPQLLSPLYGLQRLAEETDLDLSLPAKKLDFDALANEMPSITIPAIRLTWPSFFNTLGNAIEDVCKFLLPDDECPDLGLSGSTTLLNTTTLVDLGDFVSLVFDGVSDVDGDGRTTANDLLGQIGLPTDFNGVVEDFLGFASDTLGSVVDWVPDGGVKYTDMGVTVMTDEVAVMAANQAETLSVLDALSTQMAVGFAGVQDTLGINAAESTRQRIEDNLAGRSNEPIARYMLPERFGGELETVRAIVEETIETMIAAGEPVYQARMEFRRGTDAMAASEFKDAYRHFAKAYAEATK